MEDSTSDSTRTADLEKAFTLSPTRTATWATGRKINILVMVSTSTRMERDIMGNS